MWRYPGLLHEAWIGSDGNCCLPFGPEGDGARALLDSHSVCVIVFWADSHFDCMKFYHKLVHGETYYLLEGEEWKREPYREDQIDAQQQYLQKIKKNTNVDVEGLPAATCDAYVAEILIREWQIYLAQ